MQDLILWRFNDNDINVQYLSQCVMSHLDSEGQFF